MTTMTTTTRRLGRSDLQVSALGLGCWAIGGAMASGAQPLGYAGVDDNQARQALDRAVALGITLFDTADAYGAGHSERLLAPMLAAHPEVLVATKFGNTIDEDHRQLTGTDTSPGYVRPALLASLRRLGRDRVDLYQLHVSDITDDRALELVAVLEDLVDVGLVRWYGISTDDPGRVELFATGRHCTAVQLQLNVLDNNPDVLAACDRHDLAALCRSPLVMGLLGGRYTTTGVLPAGDIRGASPHWLRWFTDGRQVSCEQLALDRMLTSAQWTDRPVGQQLRNLASTGPPKERLQSPTGSAPPRFDVLGFVDLGSSSLSGLAHAVGLAVGDDGVAVVEEPVEEADGGGVLGQEPAPGKGRVGADAEAAAFVGGGDEPEQQPSGRALPPALDPPIDW